MNLTALKSWVSGETLTAADLNAEFQNIYTHTINNSDIDSTASYVLGELVIGTGLAAADGGQLHVHTGSAGTVQAASDADEAVFENSTASGITILSGLTSTGKVAFGDSGDNDVGLITYNHATDAMTFTTNGATALTLSSAQAATFAGDVSVGGALTLTGGLTLNGAVVVGDSASDTLTVNATVTSDLLFTDATYDIGKSGATRPRDGFFSRNMAVGGTLGVTGATTLSSTLGVTGALTATAGITSGSDIVSDSDSTDDLGTTSVRWANLYVDSIGDTGQALAITAGSNNVNVTAGTLALTGAQTISSTLGVTGLITASGGVSGTTGTFSSTLGVTGATTLSSDVGIGVAAGSALTSTGTTLTIKEDDNTNSANIEMIGGNASGEVAGRIKASYTNNVTSSEVRFSLGPNGADNGETMFFTRGPDGFLERFKVGQGTVSVTGDLAVDTDTLFVDASADRVGINTAAPQGTVHAHLATDKNIRLQVLGAYAGIGALNDDSSSYIQMNLEASDLVVGQYSGGNMGLGVVPSAWSGRTALEIEGASTGYVTSPNGPIAIGSNIYYNGGDKFVGNGYAPLYALSSGNHIWYTSNNNTSGAGAAVTLTQAMTLTNAGKLCINRTSGNSALSIDPHSTGEPNIQLYNKTNDSYTYLKNDGSKFLIQNSYGTTAGFKPIQFMANGSVNLHIDEVGGSVGIGTSSPSAKFVVSDGGNTGLEISPYHGGSVVNLYSYDRSASAYRGLRISGEELIFLAGSGGSVPERARILSSGGITFNGDTSSNNALSDYEQGTFSVGIAGSTTAGSVNVTSTAGYYTKIGNVVHAFGYVSWNSATGTGNLKLTGLPFTSSSSGQYYPAGSMTSADLTFSHTITPYVSLGSTFMQIQQSQSGAAATFVPVDASATIYFNVTYFV